MKTCVSRGTGILPMLGTKEAEEAQRTTGETPVGLMGKMPMLRTSSRLDDGAVAVGGPGPAGTKALEVDDFRRDAGGCGGQEVPADERFQFFRRHLDTGVEDKVGAAWRIRAGWRIGAGWHIRAAWRGGLGADGDLAVGAGQVGDALPAGG